MRRSAFAALPHDRPAAPTPLTATSRTALLTALGTALTTVLSPMLSRTLCAAALAIAAAGPAGSAQAPAAPPALRIAQAADSGYAVQPPAPALQTAPDPVTTAPAAAAVLPPPLPKPDDTNAARAKSQPGNNSPFWRGVRESGRAEGVVSLPGAEKGVLVQRFVQYPGSRFTTAGEAWREVRNRWILPYGGAFVVLVVLALAIYYWRMGPLGGHVPDTGRLIERFTPFERAAHWANAAAFVTLAVSGLVMAFGKFLLLPVLGGTLFGLLTYALKTAHNFAGPLFAVSLTVVFFTFLRDNWPTRDDITWLLRAGGMFGGGEPPTRRFNAGEKIIFWGGVFLLGLFVVGSGLVLDKLLPGVGDVRRDMQWAHMVHSTAAVLMIGMFLGHIYLGTIGMKDANKAMRTGFVDEGWAKEHHAIWYDDVRAGRIPVQRSTEPAPAPLLTPVASAVSTAAAPPLAGGRPA